jgi:hypothetical protein
MLILFLTCKINSLSKVTEYRRWTCTHLLQDHSARNIVHIPWSTLSLTAKSGCLDQPKFQRPTASLSAGWQRRQSQLMGLSARKDSLKFVSAESSTHALFHLSLISAKLWWFVQETVIIAMNQPLKWTSLFYNHNITSWEMNKCCLRVNEQMNILHEISKRKANWIGHILRRNCLLQRVIEGKIKGVIELTGRRGRRRRKLLDDLEERRGYSHLKEEALDRTMWRARFGRRFGPAVR